MIETERLILRHWTLDDVPSIVAIYGDPETMRLFADGTTFSPQELAASLEHVMKEYAHAGLGNCAVVEKSSRAVIGHCGVHRQSNSDDGEADWLIARDRWGRGYATEAAVAVMRGAFNAQNLPSISAVAHRDNVASIAVMRKLRMSFVSECERYGFPSVLYRISREDFAAGSA
jgi:RimJ/RimL family protein N-acetyltransferase